MARCVQRRCNAGSNRQNRLLSRDRWKAIPVGYRFWGYSAALGLDGSDQGWFRSFDPERFELVVFSLADRADPRHLGALEIGRLVGRKTLSQWVAAMREQKLRNPALSGRRTPSDALSKLARFE